jgi:putative FmdB family regulatory protein
MPLYEYQCRACGDQFEALVRGTAVPSCPACHSGDLEKLLSTFGVQSDSTRQHSLQAAKRASRKAAVDKAIADREHDANHHH